MAESEDPKQLFGMYVAHVGINASSDEEAEAIVKEFSDLMGLARQVI